MTPDDKLCEFCAAMESEYNAKIGLDDSYFSIGDEVNGINGGVMTVDFDNVESPPLHCNCRCVLKSVEKLVTKQQKTKKKKAKKSDRLLKEIDKELNDIRKKAKKPQKQTTGKEK